MSVPAAEKTVESVETVEWTAQATLRMRKKYGPGPFPVKKVIPKSGVTNKCYPGDHDHYEVELVDCPAKWLKRGTFCRRFLQPATA